MLGQKANFSKNRKIEIVPYIPLDHYAIKLKITAKSDKFTDIEPLITE